MRKIFFTVLFSPLMFASYGQVTDALNILNELSGSLNELDVFLSMDETLRNIENIEKSHQQLKNASDWYDRMKHIKRTLALLESSTCAVKSMSDIYGAYLGSVWKDWDDQGGCATGLKYQVILTKAELISEMISEIASSNNLTEAERNELSLELSNSLESFLANIELFMDEISTKVNAVEAIKGVEKNYISPSNIELESYADFDSIRDSLTGSSFQSLFWALGSLALMIGLVPVIYGAMINGNLNYFWGWLAVFMLFTILSRII